MCARLARVLYFEGCECHVNVYLLLLIRWRSKWKCQSQRLPPLLKLRTYLIAYQGRKSSQSFVVVRYLCIAQRPSYQSQKPEFDSGLLKVGEGKLLLCRGFQVADCFQTLAVPLQGHS